MLMAKGADSGFRLATGQKSKNMKMKFVSEDSISQSY